MTIAGQDQTIQIEMYNVNVLHSSNDFICLMYHSSDETIFHVFS